MFILLFYDEKHFYSFIKLHPHFLVNGAVFFI